MSCSPCQRQPALLPCLILAFAPLFRQGEASLHRRLYYLGIIFCLFTVTSASHTYAVARNINLFHDRVLPFYEARGVTLERVLRDNGLVVEDELVRALVDAEYSELAQEFVAPILPWLAGIEAGVESTPPRGVAGGGTRAGDDREDTQQEAEPTGTDRQGVWYHQWKGWNGVGMGEA
jgi:hypothetical protein